MEKKAFSESKLNPNITFTILFFVFKFNTFECFGEKDIFIYKLYCIFLIKKCGYENFGKINF